MQKDERPIFVTRKVFLRRLTTRLAASIAVMVGLNALSHDEPGDAPAGVPAVMRTADRADPGLPAVRQAALQPAPGAVEWPGERTGRLSRTSPGASVPAPAPVHAEKAAPSIPPGVLLFDRCAPACESRDPLLAGRRVAEAEPPRPLLVASSASDAQEGGMATLGTGGPATDAERPGLVRAVSSNLAAVAQTGARAVGSGIGMITPW